MRKFYGYAPFSGHFWTGERIFYLDFRKLFFILVNLEVSGDVSIQMPTKMPLLGAKVVNFTKNAPHLKKIRYR
jgi:hypothetical protein